MINLLKKIIFILIAHSMIYTNSFGINLHQALVSTYKTNEELKKAQIDLINTVEGFSQALSEFLPHISFAYTYNPENKSEYFSAESTLAPDSFSSFEKRFQIQQNLFSGGSDLLMLKSKSLSFYAAKAGFYDNEQKILLKAIQVYLQYLQARKIYDISDVSVRFYQKTYDQEIAKLKYGESNKTNVANAEAGLYYAQYQRYESQSELEQAAAQFKQVIGLEPIGVEDISTPLIPSAIEEFSTKVLANNLYLKAQILVLKAANSEISSNVGKLLPSLNVFYDSSGVSYGKQSAQKNHVDHSNSRYGFSLEIPILFRGGVRYSQIRLAKNKARLAVLDIAKQKKDLQAQILGSWSSYLALKAGMHSAKISIQAQILAVSGINQEFNLGLKNIIEVLKTEQDLINYQVNQVKLENKYFSQIYNMKYLMGDLTAKNLGLKVKLFNPDAEFKKMKFKVIGF